MRISKQRKGGSVNANAKKCKKWREQIATNAMMLLVFPVVLRKANLEEVAAETNEQRTINWKKR